VSWPSVCIYSSALCAVPGMILSDMTFINESSTDRLPDPESVPFSRWRGCAKVFAELRYTAGQHPHQDLPDLPSLPLPLFCCGVCGSNAAENGRAFPTTLRWSSARQREWRWSTACLPNWQAWRKIRPIACPLCASQGALDQVGQLLAAPTCRTHQGDDRRYNRVPFQTHMPMANGGGSGMLVVW
jgi:hypothetical protein